LKNISVKKDFLWKPKLNFWWRLGFDLLSQNIFCCGIENG
jgi:hypothetical protein